MDMECQLQVERFDITKPRYPAIDSHTHFGKLFGMIVGSDEYFDLYRTKDAVEKIKSFGIERVVNLDGCFGDEYLRMTEKLCEAGDFFLHFGWVDIERFEEPSFEKEIYKTVRQHHENGIKGLKLWKIIGLSIQESSGKYLRPDDPRLKCIWESAAEFKLPVLFHISDPVAFFQANDEKNEYADTLIDFPEWSFSDPALYSFDELMEMQQHVLEENPKTTFIIPHVGSYAENLKRVGQWLDRYPNMYIDIAERLSELGRQPYTARKFFSDYSDRILFGTDMLPTDIERYPIYYRFLETYEEYFPYRTQNGIFLGNWNIYGIGLDDFALKNIYRDNALKILGI